MNDHAWNLWLATLPVERRLEYEQLLDRITTILNHDRNVLLDDIQRLERRQAQMSQMIQGIEQLRRERAVGE